VVNDVRIAAWLDEFTGATVFLLGGIIRKGFHYINLNPADIPAINIDKAFFGCNGLSAANGATVPDYQLAAQVARLVGLASESILLCDSSKIGGVLFARIAPLSAITHVVVDSGIDSKDYEELRDAGNIIIAE
jgi:DeoR family fructose operon transcriptional repressor